MFELVLDGFSVVGIVLFGWLCALAFLWFDSLYDESVSNGRRFVSDMMRWCALVGFISFGFVYPLYCLRSFITWFCSTVI